MVDTDHRQLDEVRRRALKRRVDSRPLGEIASIRIAAVHVGDGAAAAKKIHCHTGAAHFGDGRLDEPADAGVAFEISTNVELGLAPVDAQTCRKAEGCLAIDYPEVHRLGSVTVFGSDHQRRDAEYFRRGPRVDVLAVPERLDQERVVRHVGEQP